MIVWCSFCDPNKPKGKQFLGVAIVEVETSFLAISKCHELGINPGGEVQMSSIDKNKKKIRPHMNKLLSKEYLIENDLVD